MTPDDLMRQIERATEPSKMSQQEALDFLEELAAKIDGAIDGLKSDIGNAEEE